MSNYLVQPSHGVGGTLRVPGDKSISHRALMLGAIAEGVSEAHGFLESEDCLATMQAMTAMGVRIERPAPQVVRVHGVGLQGLKAPSAPLDLGNSGTAMRLMSGLLAGQRFASELVGDASLMRRPMERVAEPLRRMGAAIQTRQGRPPVTIQGVGELDGIDYELPVPSAQVKSAVLLAGLYAKTPTTVAEPAVSRDHTERMLIGFGCDVHSAGGVVQLQPPAALRACRLQIPGDFSSAAFFLVAGTLNPQPDGLLVLADVGINPTRTGLLEILALMGADIRIVNTRQAGAEAVADLEVRPARLKGIHVPEALVPLAIDEFPVLFVAAACAQGETVITGAQELRVKESDRIAVMAEGLTRLGVNCEVMPDGACIRGRADGTAFTGGVVDSHDDHRIAMSFAVASLRASGAIEIRDVANVATSFPGFAEIACQAGLQLSVQG